jgi:membrane-bound hydrogenase subunit beta
VFEEEEKIKRQLIEKFSYLTDKINVARIRRIFADAPAAGFADVFNYAVDKLGVLYHLAKENGIILNLHISVPKENPVIKTISTRFPAADAYERELVDLLGFQVEGLPAGNRYPLPDGWPAGQYPLRKDWKQENVKKEAAENA